MTINFFSPKKDLYYETHTIYNKSDNIEVFMGNET